MEAVLDRKSNQSRKAQTLQNQLLRGYLHKTSNSLCGIKGYAGLIADSGALSELTAAWAQKIITEVERMENIFQSVGDLSYKRSAPDTSVSLQSILTTVAESCEVNFRNLTVLFGRIPEGQLLMPAADLIMVLTELVKNSAESSVTSDTPVRVEITGEKSADNRIYLTVVDNGLGMVEGLLTKAVNPFLTTKTGHVGIGLARVDTLLNMYDLTWNIESFHGRGTTIRLEVANERA